MRRTQHFPVPALTELAGKIGWNPRATAFVSETREKVIVTTLTSPGKGYYVEAEATAIPFDSEPELLGQAIWEALLSFRSAPNRGSAGNADWPAFKASGEKSATAFENQFVRVSVEAFPTVLRVEATVPCKEAKGLFVGRFITNACEFEDLGELILQTSRCSLFVMEREYS